MPQESPEIYYYDELTTRQAVVRAALGTSDASVVSVPDLACIPQEAEVVLVGVDDLAAALPDIGAASSANPHQQMILLWEGEDPTLLVEAMRAGVRDVAVSPHGTREALERAWSRRVSRDASGQRKPGRVISVFALKGGVGKSTLSANLAIALHQQSRTPVTAVDLSLPCGNLEMYLDLDAPRTVADVLGMGADLDPSLVQQAIVRHRSGIGLLAGVRPGGDEAIGTYTARPMLEALASTRSLTVVDVGAYLDEAQVSALEFSDLIVVPVAPLISSIVTMPAIWEHLAALGIPEHRVLPVVNHISPDAEPIPAEVVQSLLRGKPHHALPFGGPDMVRLLNEGRPIAEHQPRCPFTRSLGSLATEALGRVALPAASATIKVRAGSRLKESFLALFSSKGDAHVRG